MNKFFLLVSLTVFINLTSCTWMSEDNYSPQTTQTDVLFMMYLDGDNNLNNAAWENFKQVQKGLMNLPKGASVTVAALIDGISKDTSARLYPGLSHIGDIYGRSFLLRIGAYTQEEFEQDNLVAASTLDYSKTVSWVYNSGRHEVDMSSGQTLYNFLNWAKSRYSASKKILVLQNHGGGPYKELSTSLSAQDSERVLCNDITTGTNNKLTTTDIATAIKSTFGKIDMLVEDVCLQCSIEEIYGLQDVTNYLIASPNSTLTNSYNYDRIIPYAGTGAKIEDIGKKFIDYNYEFCMEKYFDLNLDKAAEGPCYEYSLSLIDCSKANVLSDIKNHTSALARAMLDVTDTQDKNYLIASLGKLSTNTDNDFYGFYYNATYVYTQDLGVTAYILANTQMQHLDAVKEAAKNLYNDLRDNSLIVYGWAGSYKSPLYYSGNASFGSSGGYEMLKIQDGRCPWGISITSGSRKNSAGNNAYYKLDNYGSWTNFAKDNVWAELLSSWKNSGQQK